ncbi:MAG: Glycogen accumulation regulator GarA [Syntrophus sp. PtaB.Bin001]|nr:MAG: Glycogen accumulation regulator GarA [Syntrophus sp. PtaB.Bin001]
MAEVLLKFKGAVVKEIPLNQDVITIGRKPDNDIVIDNQAVSGHHAKFINEGDSLFVEDTNSLNGTYVNGQKVFKSEVFNGDVVLVGIHTLDVISEKNREEDTRNSTLRGRSMDETMVITPQDQRNLLAATDKSKPEPLGGFVIVSGSTEKRDYLMKERVTTIGKEDGAGIRLKGFLAPKVAALVNRRKEGYFINPSGGKSMKVNGQEIISRYDLKDGDIVEVAGLKMQFYVKD